MNIPTEVIEIDGVLIFIHDCEEPTQQLIIEAKFKGSPLTGQYSYNKHQPHNPTGEYHLHVYKKGNEIFSINKSGTGHDGYTGTRIPNNVFNTLKSNFSDWKWPDDQIIESLIVDSGIVTSRAYLRKVSVRDHRNWDLNEIRGFKGYFHTFADDPFLTGGDGGWKNRTVAIIETEDGYIRKVPVDCFRFVE